VDFNLQEGNGEFIIRVCDASNKEQRVLVTEQTTMHELAHQCGYSCEEVMGLYQVSVVRKGGGGEEEEEKGGRR